MRWARLVEGALVVAVMAGFFLVLPGGGNVRALLEGVDLPLYSLAFVAVFAWLVASGETLFDLLRTQSVPLHRGRFTWVFLGAMGLRGLVPGGFVSGPPVVAYVVASSTPVGGEDGLAMAYVAEVCYWLGSVVVAGTGLVGIALVDRSRALPSSLVGGLVVSTLVFGAVLAVGIRNPVLVERPAHWVAALGRVTVGRLSERARDLLAEEAIDRRIERVFRALRRLRDDPRHVLPALGWAILGWVVHTLALYVTLRAVGVPASPFVALFVVPAGGVAEGLAPFPGGLGTVESGQTILLAVLTSANLATIGVVVLLFRLASYWFRLPVGALCLFYLGVREPEVTESGVSEA